MCSPGKGARPCGRDPNEVEALLRERDLGETVCPVDGRAPGQHGWSGKPPPKATPELRDHLRRIGVKEHALPEVEAR